jgi:hypothetical protein
MGFNSAFKGLISLHKMHLLFRLFCALRLTSLNVFLDIKIMFVSEDKTNKLQLIRRHEGTGAPPSLNLSSRRWWLLYLYNLIFSCKLYPRSCSAISLTKALACGQLSITCLSSSWPKHDIWYIYELQLGCHPVAVHIYTQTVHRTIQITTEQHK